MRRIRSIVLVTLAVVTVSFGSAWAQLVISDPGTTARNAVTAVLKSQIVQTMTDLHQRLHAMAARLSAHTTLDRYAASGPPTWQRPDDHALLYARGYWNALNSGDAAGLQYDAIARTRDLPDLDETDVTADVRTVIEGALATLDLADSTITTGTHIAGQLRRMGHDEIAAINQLERDVLDPSHEQSATAVLDKVSGAVLIEARQKQARLQYLTAIAEQLLVDNKRARDTEAAAMGMQLGRLRAHDGQGADLLSGASHDLRTWRQP